VIVNTVYTLLTDIILYDYMYGNCIHHVKKQIYFLLVRIKIKHMELAIVRREAAGTGTNIYNESETIVKYEVMDGAPVKGTKRTVITNSNS
jgi:vacuolar protein sorting-associated protein 26